jgi:hypothetical protein
MNIAYTLSAIADENVLSRQQRDSKSVNRRSFVAQTRTTPLSAGDDVREHRQEGVGQ